MLRRLSTISVALLVLMAAPVLAAPQPPTGTIELMPDSLARSAGAEYSPLYGGTVEFLATVEGKFSKQAQVYVSVVCLQGDAVVYQYSGAPDFSFPLMDQAGQGLEWDGGAAYCAAWWIHRVEKGRAAEITYLDSVDFNVGG